MAITVKHTKVSTIPDDADTNLVRPSDWNADHTLVGLGTMAEQDANAVAITGGSITNTAIGNTTPNTGAFTTLTANKELINQSYDQGTGVLQVTGNSTFNGTVVDKTLSLQGGNNYFKYSQDFTNAAWTKFSGSISGTLYVAPDGTTTANLYTADGTSGAHAIGEPTGAITGSAKTFSIFAKAGTNVFLQLYCDNDTGAYANFNLATGALGTVGGATTASITLVNGWYRCVVAVSSTATLCRALLITSATAAKAELNTLSTSVYFWGAQLELGSVASNYTPTTTTAVTTTNDIRVPSGQVLAGNGTSSLPSYSFGSKTNTGFAYDGFSLTAFNNGALSGYFGGSGVVGANSAFTWGTDNGLFLYRDAAGTLAQRNGVNAQTLRVYNTYTDASNYERGSVYWTSNTFRVTNENAGTGSTRNMQVFATGDLFLGAGNATQIKVDPSGNTMPNGGWTPDLGGPATVNKWRNAYLTGAVTTGSGLIGQTYDQGTGALQVTGNVSNNGTVTNKSLNFQGGNNLLLQSKTFNTTWVASANTVTANTTTAPDGTTTAYSLIPTATTAQHYIAQSLVFTANTYTYSIYAKANGYNFVQLNHYASGIYANFDLSGGTVTQSAGTISTSITSVGSGWYRCSMTYASTAATLNLLVLPVTSGTVTSFPSEATNGTSGIYIWQAQLELGTVASAPTVTTTAAITTTNDIRVPTGQVIFPLATKTAPSVLLGNSNTGVFSRANNFVMLGAGGNEVAYFGSTGVFNLGGTSAQIGFASNTLDSFGPDVVLARDAANTLAQRNATNAQSFRLYNTYTDASNYERLGVNWASNTATINTENAGTGTQRTLGLQTAGGNVGIGTASADTALTVYSPSNATGSLAHFRNPAATNTPDWYMSVGGPANFEGYFKIGRTAGAYEFGIDNNGNPITSKSWYVTGNGGLVSSNNGNTFVTTNSGASLSLSGRDSVDTFTSGAKQFAVTNTASAVNYVQVTGGATGIAPVVSAQGSNADIPLVLQPKGTGALQAELTDSTAAGGNARGPYAVDLQLARSAATQVASGYYNFIGGGYANTGTATAAVTTQSATMNATTTVTLAASNASIKIGQYITGTSIAPQTYVSAISGTTLTLSQAASGSSTSTLSFFTPHGVVVGGGNNQATGSYSFIGGGGDAGTAANRNTASGDWSFVGGGGKNTASGIGSVVCGGGSFGTGLAANTSSGTSTFIGSGYLNLASGFTGVVVGGTSNNQSGNYGFIGGGANNTCNSNAAVIIGGAYGNARSIVGNHVFPACNSPIATANGITQSALVVLARQTTDATATVLCSDSNAASGTNQVIMPNNSAYFFKGAVIAGVTGAGNTKGWTIEGVIKRGANAASTAIVGTATVTSLYADAGAATWTITATADTTLGGLKITATGQAATTIRWVAKVETTEMTF